MKFEEILPLIKEGSKVYRSDWEQGIFVIRQKGYPDGIPCNKQTSEVWGLERGSLFKCNPYMQINKIDGSHSMWVPSTDDIFADDWGTTL